MWLRFDVLWNFPLKLLFDSRVLAKNLAVCGFVADNRSLGDIPPSDCTGNPLMYLTSQHCYWLLLVVASVAHLKVKKSLNLELLMLILPVVAMGCWISWKTQRSSPVRILARKVGSRKQSKNSGQQRKRSRGAQGDSPEGEIWIKWFLIFIKRKKLFCVSLGIKK